MSIEVIVTIVCKVVSFFHLCSICIKRKQPTYIGLKQSMYYSKYQQDIPVSQGVPPRHVALLQCSFQCSLQRQFWYLKCNQNLPLPSSWVPSLNRKGWVKSTPFRTEPCKALKLEGPALFKEKLLKDQSKILEAHDF